MKSILNDRDVMETLYNAGLLKCESCNELEATEYQQLRSEGKPLPKGVIWAPNKKTFLKIDPSEFSSREAEQHIVSVAQTLYLKSIKKWLTFFGVLTILGLIGGLIALIVVLAS